MTKIVAIHQPNFFPWLGYFDKILRCDAFVFLDHVQFPKKGGVWTNRVKLLVAGEPRWVTAAIARNYHGVRAINEMEFQPGNPWREKMFKTIQANYSKAPFFAETMELLEPLILNPEQNIAEYNIHAVTTIAEKLGVDQRKFYRSSKLPCRGSSNELLISLTKCVGGDTYMCGGGAEGYQDENIFINFEITLTRQTFRHPVFRQINAVAFTPGLSVIDMLLNCGLKKKCSILAPNDLSIFFYVS